MCYIFLKKNPSGEKALIFRTMAISVLIVVEGAQTPTEGRDMGDPAGLQGH